jgi:hypothetical protein
MKKLTSILLLLLFSLVLINNASAFSHEGRDWTGQECQKQRISATYTGKVQSAYCREQEEFGNIVGLVFKWFIIIFLALTVIISVAAILSNSTPKHSQKSWKKTQDNYKREKIYKCKAILSEYSKLGKSELVKKLESCDSEILNILGLSYEKTDNKKVLLKKILTYELNDLCTKEELLGLAYDSKVAEVTMKNTKAQIISAILKKTKRLK